jgi:hypothetical protein
MPRPQLRRAKTIGGCLATYLMGEDEGELDFVGGHIGVASAEER